MAARKKSSGRAAARSGPRKPPRKPVVAGPVRPPAPRPRTSTRRPDPARTVTPEQLKEFVRSRAEEFLKDPNITSVGVGYKITDDRTTPNLSIQFTVRQKVDDTRVESELGSTLIPKMFDVDGVSIPTDVLERDYEPSYEVVEVETKDLRKQRLDVLMPGISVSHPSGSAGTLGLIVFDRADDTPYLLSNWHVLHGPTGTLGDGIVQPGPFDDNRIEQNAAGTLVRSHLGLAGDCAIARIEKRGFNPEVHELGVRPTRVGRPELGDPVVKSGRTTGVTYGVVSRVDVTTKLNYGSPVGEQLIGGFEISPDPDRAAGDDEISRPGDSGSQWLAVGPGGKPTDVVVGVHFAGESQQNPREYALAAYAHAVLEKLEVSLTPASPGRALTESAAVGFDPGFLDVPVDLPTMTDKLLRDAVRVEGSHQVDYVHFSLAMSRSRRMARWVAWNIDGTRLRREGRSGLKFVFDPRIPEEFQVGDEAYSDNKLDRGHIARRADLIWGTEREAEQANRDSFFFTNITPQHQSFNQSSRKGLWGELENALFEEAEIARLRVSVLGGPLLRSKDLEYRGIQVPTDFWKVLAYVDEADGRLRAKAYILTQDDLLNDIEAFDLDPFRLYQVSLAELERKSGLRFGALGDADDFVSGAVPQSLSAQGQKRSVREVSGREDLIRA